MPTLLGLCLLFGRCELLIREYTRAIMQSVPFDRVLPFNHTAPSPTPPDDSRRLFIYLQLPNCRRRLGIEGLGEHRE